MKDTPGIHSVYGELAAGMELTKCQQCGCMQETLDALASCLATDDTDEAQSLARDVAAWRKQMQPIRYPCLGCVYCYRVFGSIGTENRFKECSPYHSGRVRANKTVNCGHMHPEHLGDLFGRLAFTQ